MPGTKQGPGGGPKRRIRTRLQSIDSTTCLILRNRSKKAIPANWRELLIETTSEVCARPPKHFFGDFATPGSRVITRPIAYVAHGSFPTSTIQFTLDRKPHVAKLQKRALDWALSACDVKRWPVPKPRTHIGIGKECFVNTGLLLKDRLVGDNRHVFNAFRLENVPGIKWQHLEQYAAKRGKAEYLGIKTVCGEPCSCRRNLPELWPLGWEMHH